MRRVAVAQRVHVRPFAETALLDRTPERALQRTRVNRRDRRAAGHAPARERGGREEPDGIAMRAPPLAQQDERAVREGDEAIASAFATADVEQFARAVDLGHLEAEAFQQAEPARVHEGQADAVPPGLHCREHPTDFVLTQDDGEPRLAFRPYLKEAFRVESIESSAARLCSLIDDVKHERIVFLAHNGPSGLGDRRDAIWGCDFRRSEGDFGDPDLEIAIAHARSCGKRVLAVVAGHMHHALRLRGTRKWIEERDDTLYVNAARVPRVFKHEGKEQRHLVEITIDDDRASAREVLF